MPSGSLRYFTLLAGFLIAPVLGLSSTVTVNGTCEAGTCPTVDTLVFGGSTSGTFNFNVLFGNTDKYNISGDYAATNPTTGGTTIHFDAIAVFKGNTTTNLSQHDLLTIDDLQDYAVPYNLDGNYTEDTASFIGGPIGAASSLTAQLFYNGNGVGVMGPFGPGSHFASANKNLLGMTSPLDADFQFKFDFAAGSGVGSFISTAVPEPGGVAPIALILAIGLVYQAIRRYSFCRRAE